MSQPLDQIIPIHGQDWLDRQRVAGKCVAACLNKAKEMLLDASGVLTTKMIESECLSIMKDFDCKPTFLGYKGFGSAICASVDKELVHGMTSDKALEHGSLVKIDLGATFNGAIADAAHTTIYGKPKDSRHVEMVNLCKLALDNAIKQVEVGKRVGCIGSSIYKTVRDSKFGLVTDFGGHGISENTPHAPPFIANKDSSMSGIRIQEGLSIAIEPLLTFNNDVKTKIAFDGWTVLANSVTAHFEHTLFIHADRVEIITKQD